MKKSIFSKCLLLLMVSVLVATISSNSFAQRRMGLNNVSADSAKFERGIPNLTADQKTKIESLRVKHAKEITPLKNELAEKQAHLKTLSSVDKPDRDAINKTIDEITALRGKIMKVNVNHRLDVSSILTDEQRVFFNSHHNGMKNGHRMGKGMKRGMNGGVGVGSTNSPN